MVVFTGWLADKVGRKKVVAWATLCTGVFSTLFAFMADSFNFKTSNWSIRGCNICSMNGTSH